MKKKKSIIVIIILAVILFNALVSIVPSLIMTVYSGFHEEESEYYSDLRIQSVESALIEDPSDEMLAVNQKAYMLTLTVVNCGNKHESLKYHPFSVYGVDGYACIFEEEEDTDSENYVDERIFPVGREVTLQIPIITDDTVSKINLDNYYAMDEEQKEIEVTLGE